MKQGAAILTAICLAGCASSGAKTETSENAISGTETVSESVSTVSIESASPPQSGLKSYHPPKPGTMLRLKSVFHGEVDAELQQIVLMSGDDYAVYANMADGGFSGPADLFVEYSGLYWQDCTEPPLSDYQRGKLQDLWPVSVGKSVTLPFKGNVAEAMTVSVVGIEKATHASLGELDVVRVANSYESVDYSDFSPKLGVSIRIDWGEPGTDANIGYDELVSLGQADLSQVSSLIELAQQHCMPAS